MLQNSPARPGVIRSAHALLVGISQDLVCWILSWIDGALSPPHPVLRKGRKGKVVVNDG